MEFLETVFFIGSIASTMRWCYLVGMYDGSFIGFVFAIFFLFLSPVAGVITLPTVLIELCQKQRT